MSNNNSNSNNNDNNASTNISKTSVAGISALAFIFVSASMGATIYRSIRLKNKAQRALIDFRSNYHIEKRPTPLPNTLKTPQNSPTPNTHPNPQDNDGTFSYGDAIKALGIATASVTTISSLTAYYLINKFDIRSFDDLNMKLKSSIPLYLYKNIHKPQKEDPRDKQLPLNPKEEDHKLYKWLINVKKEADEDYSQSFRQV